MRTSQGRSTGEGAGGPCFEGTTRGGGFPSLFLVGSEPVHDEAGEGGHGHDARSDEEQPDEFCGKDAVSEDHGLACLNGC